MRALLEARQESRMSKPHQKKVRNVGDRLTTAELAGSGSTRVRAIKG